MQKGNYSFAITPFEGWRPNSADPRSETTTGNNNGQYSRQPRLIILLICGFTLKLLAKGANYNSQRKLEDPEGI